MLIRYEMKQTMRTPLRVTVLLLALAVMIVMLTVSTGLSMASASALQRMEEEYVTLVEPIPPNENAYDDRTKFQEDLKKYSEQERAFRALAPDMETVETYTEHSIWGAYIHGVMPLTVGLTDDETYSFAMNRPVNMVMLTVRCVRADKLETHEIYGRELMTKVAYRMELDEVLMSHEDVRVGRNIHITTGVRLEDGREPFEVGERYLIWGVYDASSENSGTLILPTDIMLGYIDPHLSQSHDGATWETAYDNYDYRSEVLLRKPVFAHLGEVSADEIMRSELWRETVDRVEVSISSLRVFTTDHIPSHAAFLDRTARMVAGRTFSEREIKNGERVCVLNRALAERNGLSVGDTVELNFYQTNFVKERILFSSSLYPNYLYNAQFDAEQAAEETGTYTIVGLYELDHAKQGEHTALHPNTVIVPQSTMHSVNPSLNVYSFYTAVIPNDGFEAFRKECVSLGLEVNFSYDDQGYAETVPHLTMLHTSVRAIHRLCICLWVLVMAVLIMMYLLMQNAAAQVKFRVGVSRGRIFGHTLFGGLLLLAVSSALGGGASVLLYNTVLGKLMDSDFTVFYAAFGSKSESTEILTRVFEFMQQSPETLIRICAMQLGAAAILLILFAAWLYLRPAHYRK